MQHVSFLFGNAASILMRRLFMRKFAAVDIGGTAIKYGVVNENGQLLNSDETATEAENGSELLTKKVDGIVGRLVSGNPGLGGIGISTAGIVDTQKGSVIYAGDNIPGYTGTVWKRPLEEKYALPVIVNNDVNSAALAESWVGAAKGIDNFFCVTIGTGVGGAAFVNGRLFTGAHYRAAEIGYMNTDKPGKYFEKSASTSALVRMSEERTGLSGLNGKTVFQKAFENDPVFNKIIEEWFDSLSRGIANVIYMFDPSMIVIGGGVSHDGDYLIRHLKKGLDKALTDKLFLENIEFKPAACKNSAGMIGSVYGFANKAVI